MIGDFNAKSKDWCSINIASFWRFRTWFSRFSVWILANNWHIYSITQDAAQPNMVIDSGVHASLDSNSHHQIIYAKFDLKTTHPLPRGQCDISNMQTLIISKGQLTSLIGNPL